MATIATTPPISLEEQLDLVNSSLEALLRNTSLTESSKVTEQIQRLLDIRHQLTQKATT